MKRSELIKIIENDIKESGDLYIREVKIVDEAHGSQTRMYSPTRRNSKGERMYMNHKELIEYANSERQKDT